MLNAEFLKEIKGSVQSEVIEIENQFFHKTNQSISPMKFQDEDCVKLFSITQLLSYLESRDKTPLLVNIKDHENIQVIKKDKNKNLCTTVIAETTFENMFEPFPNNQRLSQEDFIIQLQSRFASSPETDSLIKLISVVTSGKTKDNIDNGYSQEAVVKTGVTLKEQILIKPVWILKPFKTFPEIEPVEVPFVLRLHQSSEEVPKFAMYEADGGMWKVMTTIRLRDYLKEKLASLDHVKVL